LQIKNTIYKNGKLNLVATAEFGALVFAGYAAYNMLRGSDEDDEFGKKKMDAQGAGTVSKNMLFPDGKGGYNKVGVPFGLPQIAYAMGVAMSRVEHGVYTEREAAGEMVGAWLKAFAATGGSEVPMLRDLSTWLTYTFTPTIAKPIASVALGKDAFGNPLTLQIRKDKPAYEQGRFQTPEEYKEAAKWADKNLGIDRAPEEYRAITEGYALGPFRAMLGLLVDKEKNADIKGLDKKQNSPLMEALGYSRIKITGSDAVIVNNYFTNASKEVNEIKKRLYQEIPEITREKFDDKLLRFAKAGATPSEIAILKAEHTYQSEYKKILEQRKTQYKKYIGGDDAASAEMGKAYMDDMIEKRKFVQVYVDNKESK
jgi:Large polyvalent protein associated domain 38